MTLDPKKVFRAAMTPNPKKVFRAVMILNPIRLNPKTSGDLLEAMGSQGFGGLWGFRVLGISALHYGF